MTHRGPELTDISEGTGAYCMATDKQLPLSPLGTKGYGERAIHMTPAAVLFTINNARTPLSTLSTEVPASPNRLWRLIQTSQQDRSDA